MECTTKYPRTYHLPFSEGLINDDRRVDDDWEQYIINQPIILTEKMDGENSSITKFASYARSHAAPTCHPWNKNLWEKGGLHDQIKDNLLEEDILYGENMYAIHSIEYNKLPSFFFLFGIRFKDVFGSWHDVEIISSILEIPTVPVLWDGVVSSSKELENLIDEIMNGTKNFNIYSKRYYNGRSKYGDTIEGVVVRNAKEFHFNDFSKYVVKYVRKNHVQTDKFWQRNWKRAEICY